MSGHQKNTVDYNTLVKESHSKMEIVRQIPHEGEVIRARQNPHSQGIVASMTASGVINLYNVESAGLTGRLNGLAKDSFSLSWSRQREGYLLSSAGTQVCIWDVNHLSKTTGGNTTEKN